MKKVVTNWEEKYYEMEARCRDLERRLIEDYTPSVTINTNAEIIKRLDIIGNMLGNYIKKQELEESKTKMNKVKDEYEMLSFDVHSRELQYSNRYEDELRWKGDCK